MRPCFGTSLVHAALRLGAASLLLSHWGAQAAPVQVLPVPTEAANAGPALSVGPTMPWIEAGDDAVSRRINNVIYIEQFDVLAPGRRPSELRALVPPAVSPPTKVRGFQVRRNDDAVLALDIDLESCGAYCEPVTARYNFDLRAGRRLLASDLFTPAGMTAVARLLEARRVVAVKAASRTVAERAKGQADAQARDNDLLMVRMYDQCLTPARPADLWRFPWLLADGGVAFTHGRCSNHALRALDTLGDFHQTLATAVLRPHLTAYGQAVLAGSNKVPAVNDTDLSGQVLRGTLNGRTAITLMMTLPTAAGTPSVPSAYFYDQYRGRIPLASTFNKNLLKMTEVESADRPQPTIEATIAAGRMSGVWKGKDKQMRFEAGR